MNFGKVPKGGRGVILNPKIHIAELGPSYRFFFGRFAKILQYIFFENEGGGGSKAIWRFSENLSDLVAGPFP